MSLKIVPTRSRPRPGVRHGAGPVVPRSRPPGRVESRAESAPFHECHGLDLSDNYLRPQPRFKLIAMHIRNSRTCCSSFFYVSIRNSNFENSEFNSVCPKFRKYATLRQFCFCSALYGRGGVGDRSVTDLNFFSAARLESGTAQVTILTVNARARLSVTVFGRITIHLYLYLDSCCLPVTRTPDLNGPARSQDFALP